MSAIPAPTPSRRHWTVVLGVSLVLVALISVLLLWLWSKPAADMEAALAANLRGIGHMERFEYAEASREFNRVVEAAPTWTPGWINLGIALLNQDTPEAHTRARKIFTDVVSRNSANRHAHYCLGILCSTRGPFAEAYSHFLAVHELDPGDAHTLLRLGLTHPNGKESPEALAYFEQALKRNPYLNAARYNLALALGASDPARAARLFEEHRALMSAVWETESGIRYSEMGRYAEVIGRDSTLPGPRTGPLPLFEPLANLRVELAPGARWATSADLDATHRAALQRFGGAMLFLDHDGDGRPDLLLLAAVMENDRVRNLLLHNEGSGTFRDVTQEAGLHTAPAALTAAAGDFDNDGHVDLFLAGAGQAGLFRNNGKKGFDDVTRTASLDQLTGCSVACTWMDIDQDGDLDLLVCRYSGEAKSTFERSRAGGECLLFENIGIAPPAPRDGPAPGLTVAFQPGDRFPKLDPPGACVAVVGSDLDADRDMDLLVLRDEMVPTVVWNDRLLRFRSSPLDWGENQPAAWNGALILDANHDERSDLFLLPKGKPPILLLSRGEKEFITGRLTGPELQHAVATDLDMDGWPDVLGQDTDGRPVFLHNQGDGQFRRVEDGLGVGSAGYAVATADLDGDGRPDVIQWHEKGLRVLRNGGNGNAALLVTPTGRRDRGSDQRTNADGIGSWIVAQAGSVWTGAERISGNAGRGQSLLPTLLGIGKHERADVVRIRWPDAVIQAELGVVAGSFRVTETNRKGTSCPILLAWDGKRFGYVTDFLGAGALGESGPDGSIRSPRPEESVKIEPEQLVPQQGELLLKIAEPMDEVLYLDHLLLEVVDHPSEVMVYPDERFVFSGPFPSQNVLAFGTRHLPRKAIDHQGRDVTDKLRLRDRLAVDDFSTRSWLGYAEEHSLTVEFPPLPQQGRAFLVLAGWTEYPYPESMYAATRAGIPLHPPVLEQETQAGEWVALGDLGFPAGLPRVMVRELPTDYAGGRLRIRTNMQIYWDQIHLAQGMEIDQVGRTTRLEISRATLAARGFIQEIYPNGRPPVAYDDAKTEAVTVTPWKGLLTRLGEVTDLLRQQDDRFTLCGPGDEITVAFPAQKLPALPAGWKRSYVLRTHGYCKDTSTTTVTGGSISPLPFRAMSNYPPTSSIEPSVDDGKKWHTRRPGQR